MVPWSWLYEPCEVLSLEVLSASFDLHFRIFGPALVSLDFTYHWIWWLSEILGASFAVLVESLFFAPIKISEASEKSNLIWWRALMMIFRKKYESSGDNVELAL